MKNFDMTGKTVLITGASRGIGAAAAQAFAAAGANVAFERRELLAQRSVFGPVRRED